MVDNTREAFGLGSVDRRTRRQSAVSREEPKPLLNIDDTSYYNRPITAAREDIPVRENEDGSVTYLDVRGREYTVMPTQPVARPEGGYARAAARAVSDAVSNVGGIGQTLFSDVPRAIQSAGPVARQALSTFTEQPRGPAAVLSGTRPATMGDVADVSGTAVLGPLVGATGRATRAATATAPQPTAAPEPPAMTIAQQTEEALPAPTPSVAETPPVAAPEATRTPQPRPAARIEVPRYMQASPEAAASAGITFNSPITEVLNTMPVPSKGIKGSEFIKALKANPTVRTTHVNSLEANIDPARRYTREELAGLTESRAQVRVLEGQPPSYHLPESSETRYHTFQRQYDLNHPEEGYFELVINYDGPQGIAPIRGADQHYDPNTLAHTRASIRRDETGQQYILAEEWQSDLLQKGSAKPKIVTRKQQQEYLDKEKNKYSHRDIVDDVGPNDAVFIPTFNNFFERVSYALDNLTVDDITRIKNSYSSRNDGRSLWYTVDEQLRDNYPDIYSRLDGDSIDLIANIIKDMPMSQPVGIPPITKTEEATRLVMDSLIAEASRRGINRIVLTPYDKILEKRASDLAATYGKKLKRNVTPQEAIEMAKQPKSGMYDTYVRSTQRVLEDLPEGAVVRERMLPYNDDALVDNPAVTNLFREYTNVMVPGATYDASGSIQDAVDVASVFLDQHRRGAATETQSRAVARFAEYLENTVPGFQATDDVMENGASFIRAIRPLLQPKDLPAIEIDITDLLQQGLDLQRPRFNQGGLVDANTEAQTNELFNAVPPETTMSPARAAHKAWMQRTMQNLTANARRM